MLRPIRGCDGFTLTEALLVAAMLGIMAGFAVPHISEAIDNAAAASVAGDAHNVGLAVNQFLQAGGTLPPTGNAGEVPTGLQEYLEETMTFSRRDAIYRLVTQPVSGTAQLWVDYPTGSPMGYALQAFREPGRVTWTPTRTTFFLIQ